MDTEKDLLRFIELAWLTNDEVAKLSGVSPNTFTRWKSGTRAGPRTFIAARDAAIELAHQRGTLPVTDKDRARSLGVKKLIKRMSK